MSDAPVAAPAPSPEPEAVSLPTPISVEPRIAAPAEAAEVARQAEEAKLPKEAVKAPDAKKVEEPKKPLSTREVLRAAREKVEAESATPLKSEAAKTEPAEAKAAEAAKTEPAVARAADGKFVSADPSKVAADPAPKEAPAAEVADPAPKETPKPSFTAEPPPKRFSKEAQDEWAAAPEKVRSEALRMEKELVAGFEKHRASAESFKDYQELDEIAKGFGKKGADVFRGYYEMEQMLRKDPDKGLEAIFQNIGISARDWATKLLGQTPDVAASKADATVTELRNHNAALEQRLAALEGHHTKVQTDTTTEAVTKFAATHSRFDELSEDIAFFLKTRHPGDLAKAYEAAERLNPAPAAKEPEPQPTPAPAAEAAPVVAKPTLVPPVASQAGQKSIAGAPTAGSDPARKQPSSSIKEALKRARQAVA